MGEYASPTTGDSHASTLDELTPNLQDLQNIRFALAGSFLPGVALGFEQQVAESRLIILSRAVAHFICKAWAANACH